MVQVIEGNNFWRDIGMQAGEGFTQGYNQRADDMAIRSALDALPSNASPREVINAITGSRASVEAKKRAGEAHIKGIELEQSGLKARADAAKVEREEREKQEKLTREIANAHAIIDAAKDLSQEEKEAYKAAITSETAAKEVAKGEKKEALSEFEKVVQKKNAEQYIKATEDLPKLRDTKKNLDDIEKLIPQLYSGLPGYAEAAIGTKASSELQALGFSAIEPIVKVFNPSGPIAQKKLEQLAQKFAITPYDTKWTMQGKLKVLRQFADQAENRAKEKIALYERYKGNPPSNVVEAFDKESDLISDMMVQTDLNKVAKEEEIVDEEQKQLPAAQAFSGKTIKSPNGKKYKSDGTQWIPL